MRGLTICLVVSLVACEQTARAPENVSAIGEGLPFYATAELTPEWPNLARVSSSSFHRIRPFRLTNQNGEAVTEAALRGKITVVNFFFASCGGICPRMTENLRTIQEEFLEDEAVVLLSHSVTPDIDTASALKVYGEVKGVREDKWHLLTGERDSIYAVARGSYFADRAQEQNSFLHTEKVFLVDRDLRIRGVYNGTRAMDMRRLEEDIRALKTTKGGGVALAALR